MIKKLSILLSFTFVLIFSAACSNVNSEENQDTDVETETSEDNSEGAAENMPEELNIYIVRHGKTMLNTTDRVQGWSDAVLTPAGEEIVTEAGIGLNDINFQNVYSSDSGRAIQTAEIIMAENEESKAVDITTDSRFREFNFGTYEGDENETMWQDIADSQGITLEEFLETLTPEMFADSVAALDAGRDEEGVNWPAEDYSTITNRLSEGFDELIENESQTEGSGNILLVSHGLSISALLDTYFDDFDIPTGGLENASVSIVKYKDGEFTLESVNDMSFVEEGQEVKVP